MTNDCKLCFGFAAGTIARQNKETSRLREGGGVDAR